MAHLPPPSKNPFWKSYQIQTPTFQLTPVEKPDMSPFLFHMTGKNQILSILKEYQDQQKGFLKAFIPEDNPKSYNAVVTCFTESRIFALDFFRYRSYRRWLSDQRFGIGFSKKY